MATSPIIINFKLSSSPGGPATAVFSADPELEKVAWGTTADLVWTLQPSGPEASMAQFHPQQGIVFAPSAKYPAVWPNAQPAAVPGSGNMQYSVLDPNYGTNQDPIIYKYNVTVVVGTDVYTWDPEEENDPKGGG